MSNLCTSWKIPAWPKYFSWIVSMQSYWEHTSYLRAGCAHEWFGKCFLKNEQTVERPSVHWPYTESTGMGCELCYFSQIFQPDLIHFLSLSWGETREYVQQCISIWFLLSLNGVTFENYLLQINFGKMDCSLISTCHFFSLSSWYPTSFFPAFRIE